MEQQPWIRKLMRMKWLMATLTMIVLAVNKKFTLGLDDKTTEQIVWVACAWIVAEGGADAAGAIGKAFGNGKGNGTGGDPAAPAPTGGPK